MNYSHRFNILLIIIMILYIHSTFYVKYISWLPNIPIHPINSEESIVVEELRENINKNEEYFFRNTDKSVVYAFTKIVPETVENLENMITSFHILFTILFFKYLINRARPYQVNQNIKKLSSTTDKTPSFPAGHAFQAYYLAKQLSKKYPDKKSVLYNTAKQCDVVRVKAGIHYPSDGYFSRKLVDLLY